MPDTCRTILRSHEDAPSDDESPPPDSWRSTCFCGEVSVCGRSEMLGLDRKKKNEGGGRTGALRLSPLLTGDEPSFGKDVADCRTV